MIFLYSFNLKPFIYTYTFTFSSFSYLLMLQVIRTLVPDPDNQESLVAENTPDPLAGEQVE